MIRVKFIQNHKQYQKGDTESFSSNVAFGLIDSGKAIISKDISESDYTPKVVSPEVLPKTEEPVAQIPSVFTAPPKTDLKTKIKEK